MKKFLPILLFLFVFVTFLPTRVFAQTPTPIGGPPSAAAAPTPADEGWIQDPDVTFTGKMASRANDFLNWTLQNHQWSNVTAGSSNPLSQFWLRIALIIGSIFILFVPIAGIVMMFSRGKSITVRQFIIRILVVGLLITMSYPLIAFIYQLTDAVQGFFLRNPDPNIKDPITKIVEPIISSKNLLNVGFDYSFMGYRKQGIAFDESAYISLLLVKMTAITYYVMSGLLLIRKIILWFFLIISPVFPLLFLYAPLRNTAKIWMGEFFRWLLYAPIFAMLLSGLVSLWLSPLPLPFDFTQGGCKPEKVVYPTSINILLGGPCQKIGLKNSVNYTDTFAQYVVALLMLWVIILLPFLLLQIFLDYFHSVSLADTSFVKQIISASTAVFGKNYPTGPPGAPPSGVQPAGLARLLPFSNKLSFPSTAPERKDEAIPIVSRATQRFSVPFVRENPFASSQVLPIRQQQMMQISQLTNLSIPTMRDVARYETALMRSDVSTQSKVSQMQTTLQKIANPIQTSSLSERRQYTEIREKLLQERQQGNPIAATVLTTAAMVTQTSQYIPGISQMHEMLRTIANPASVTNSVDRQRVTQMRNRLLTEKLQGNPLATSILAASDTVSQKGQDLGVTQQAQSQLVQAKERDDPLATSVLSMLTQPQAKQPQTTFPAANRVQQVSLDDYESVKKMWTDNYTKLDPPLEKDGTKQDRSQWIRSDIEKINKAITLLSSVDTTAHKEGMDMVAKILPFLLIGGFSQTEVIAYLKAKLEAAKQVLSDVEKNQEEEDTQVEKETKKHEAEKEMHAQALQDPLDASEEKTGRVFDSSKKAE